MATRTVIDLSDTPIIKDLVTKLAALGGRFALVESGIAGIAEDTRQALATADAAFDASLNPRTIASTQIVNGHLIITYSDGTMQDAGLIGGVVPDVPTLANTLADAGLPLSAIPGLLERVNAIVARMDAIGIAATDQNVAAAITAALANIGTQIDAIDLHQTWAVVLPLLEGYVTQLEAAATNAPTSRALFTDPFFADPFFRDAA